jgi:hypothetical protein
MQLKFDSRFPILAVYHMIDSHSSLVQSVGRFFDAFLCGFDMAPQILGTIVCSLKSTTGLSFPHEVGLEPLELGSLQSCLAVSGSPAESQNLHRCRRAGAQVLYGDQGPAFVNCSTNFFVCNTGVTGVYAAGGSSGCLPVNACVSINCASLSHGCVTVDAPYSTPLDATEDR